MTYFLGIILLYLNLLFALNKKHSKILTILLIIFLWVLFWGNYQNPDYNNYLRSYNEIAFLDAPIINHSGSEFGFRFLMKLGSLFNISYNGFIMIISAMGFMLIYSTVTKFTENLNYVFLLYFLTPFFLDVVQVRNFLAMAILIFSTRYLFYEDTKNNIKFLISILLATTIHYSAILYLPMVFINKTDKKKIVKFIVLISIVLSISTLFLDKNILPVIAGLAYKISNNKKIVKWFESRTRYGYILFFAMHFINFLMISITKKYANNNLENKDGLQGYDKNEINNYYKFVELVYWINVYAFAFFPFYIIASTFTRLMRNLLLLNYIAFSITSDSFKHGDYKKILFNLEIFTYVVVLFLIYIYIPYKDSILIAILKNNFILR